MAGIDTAKVRIALVLSQRFGLSVELSANQRLACEDFVKFALDQFQKRMAHIERARGGSPGEIWSAVDNPDHTALRSPTVGRAGRP